MKYFAIALTYTLGTLPFVACNTPEPTKVAPNIEEKVSPANAALSNGTIIGQLRQAPSTDPSSAGSEVTAVRNVLPPNPATVGASLGRTFQGEIVADVQLPNKAQPASLRYMASGDRMRMRLDGSHSDFDLIADGKTLNVLNHAKNSFRKFDLTALSTAPVEKAVSADRKNDLKQTEHEDAVMFQAGLRCEEHTIKGPHTEIHACVSALPGAFERSVFERATGLSVPSWLAAMVDNDEMPVRVRGHYDNSGEFTATVVRYAPELLPDITFVVPANYVQENM